MFKNKIAKFIMILKITTKTPFIANERFLVYNIVISAKFARIRKFILFVILSFI